MFSSSGNPFGQSSSSPFGSQSAFGQTNNASSNQFTPNPFGSTSPFGSQTGSSVFGGTSSGVFGATQYSSPLISTPTFGALSSPAFGSSMPAFGASSTPAFGSSSSSFGGSSVFGQKPAFGGFGSTPQTSPFGSTFQQTQPTFGSNLFGSTPFVSSSQSAFGGSSTPAFGATSTAAFGATSSPTFGATRTPAFGSSKTPMFGSTGTAFGVSSSPAFGSEGALGASSTPVFGSSSTPFGASSTPAFGSSSTAFGASSSAFGTSSAPSFSLGSSPAFGQSSSAFGSSPFGTTPSPFGNQSSPFGSQATTPTFGSSGFDQSIFGGQRGGTRVAFYTRTPEVDGGGTQPAGKLESLSVMPVFKDPLFIQVSLHLVVPMFGSTGTAFGVSGSPAFGSGGAFEASSTPVFGSSSTPAFSASGTPAFGAFSTIAFGASSTPAFGASSSAFGTSSAPSFSLGSSPAFGQSSSAFGSSPFGTTPSPFGMQSSPFGSQATTPTLESSGFGQSNFGGQRGGTRVAFYTRTPEVDGGGTQPAVKLESLSAMPVFKDKSHEELRWEDYQLGDKGSQATTPTFGSSGFGQSNFGGQRGGTRVAFYTSTPEVDGGGTQPAGKLESLSAMPVFKDKSHEELRWEDYQLGDKGSQATTQTFGSSGFGQSNFGGQRGGTRVAFYTRTPEVDGGGTQPAGKLESLSAMTVFKDKSHEELRWEDYQLGDKGSQATTPTFGSSGFGQSYFGGQRGGTRVAFYTRTPEVDGGGTQPAGKLESLSAMPVFKDKRHEELRWEDYHLGDKGGLNPAGQSAEGIGFGAPAAQSNPFGPSPAFGQSFPNPFSTSTSSNPFAPKTPAFGSSGFGTSSTPAFGSSFTPNSFGSTTSSTPSLFGASSTPAFGASLSPSLFGGSTTSAFGPSSSIFGSASAPGTTSTFGFGLNFDNTRSTPLFQSTTPSLVQTGPAFGQNTTSSFGQSSIFSTPSTLFKGNVFSTTPSLLYSSNPVGFGQATPSVSTPFESAQPSQTSGAFSVGNFGQTQPDSANGAGDPPEGGTDKERLNQKKKKDEERTPSKINQKSNGVHDDNSTEKGDSYITLAGHRAGEAAIVYEYGADIEALIPKLRHSEYYTEPQIQELATKERAEPGFCRQVKDFVVGRHGYGSVKFMGETDVRWLDLESLVQFNHREVIVYKDKSKKPPVGQGLNKPAEVTILNIKCFDKKTGQQYMEGPRVEKYKEMLKKAVQDRGAEFVSYHPIKGEWKFRVSHFSRYKLRDEECDTDCSVALDC